MACGHNCGCDHCKPTGMGAYGAVPPLAQHGFRLAIPGGPRGGQFHGRTDANPIDPAYRGGRVRALSDGMIDRFWRAPGEVVPRPNASGDLNITTITHGYGPALTPGAAMVPGGLFPPGGFGIGSLGAKAPLNIMMHKPQNWLVPIDNPIPVDQPPCPPGYHYAPPPTCPPFAMCDPAIYGPNRNPCQPNTIPVGPPGGTTQPGPIVADHCPPGQFQDAAGNCMSVQNYPYPVTQPPTPSPTVPADTSGTPSAGQPGCVSGQFDASGNCITSTVPGAATSWFTDPTQDVITGLPNWGLLAIAAGAAYLMFGQKGHR